MLAIRCNHINIELPLLGEFMAETIVSESDSTCKFHKFIEWAASIWKSSRVQHHQDIDTNTPISNQCDSKTNESTAELLLMPPFTSIHPFNNSPQLINYHNLGIKPLLPMTKPLLPTTKASSLKSPTVSQIFCLASP